jgi:membrane associated rhomboid family serine protease
VSWQDRDYSDEFQSEPIATSWLRRRPPTATLVLMILHGAAFGLILMLQHGGGEVVVGMVTLKGAESHPVGILLHPLATGGFLSALFAVLALWSLGARLEPRLGAARLVEFYVLGNVAAGAAYFGLARLAPLLATTPLDSPIGALSALCLVAYRQLRNEPVQVFGYITTAARVYAGCAVLIVGLALIVSGFGGVAWLLATVVGGGSALPLEYRLVPHRARRRRGARLVRPSLPQPVTRADSDEIYIDDILAKISREGLGALTRAERRRLEAARQEKLRRSHQEV